MTDTLKLGYAVPELLVPAKDIDPSRWAVIACDQYTSEPDHWEETRRITEGAPSTLDLILPEAYLAKDGDHEQRAAETREAMHRYLCDGVLRQLPPGVMLTERTLPGGVRKGLLLAMDLESYDYDVQKAPLIRASEKTVLNRIPPRKLVREGAPVDLPHVMLLIDDPEDKVIGELDRRKEDFEEIYSFDLMQSGGHIEGRLIRKEKDLDHLASEIGRLPRHGGMLYCVGDGNHSLATAKAIWDETKDAVGPVERLTSPLRYALCEVVNLHDPAVEFLPIHRVLFGVRPEEALAGVTKLLEEQGAAPRIIRGQEPPSAEGFVIPFASSEDSGWLVLGNKTHPLAAGVLQPALDAWTEAAGASIDYIHGDDSFRTLSGKQGALGFYMPAVPKEGFFDLLIRCGVLPRKTFSIGEADHKRYYLEARRLTAAK